mmetsp:Transcript_20167/g.44827  ORF Transcript_20167/g.44827 Transcript_20167/m.44827 type:complete len:246 (+) Transcript_20167:3488-4225(+)
MWPSPPTGRAPCRPWRAAGCVGRYLLSLRACSGSGWAPTKPTTTDKPAPTWAFLSPRFPICTPLIRFPRSAGDALALGGRRSGRGAGRWVWLWCRSWGSRGHRHGRRRRQRQRFGRRQSRSRWRRRTWRETACCRLVWRETVSLRLCQRTTTPCPRCCTAPTRSGGSAPPATPSRRSRPPRTSTSCAQTRTPRCMCTWTAAAWGWGVLTAGRPMWRRVFWCTASPSCPRCASKPCPAIVRILSSR